MDELAKKLSMFSFGVIGVICVIGLLQHRSWLDMFTIGGAVLVLFKTFLFTASRSVSGCSCYTRGSPHRHHSYFGPWRFENGKAKSHCEEAPLGRSARISFRYLFRQDRYGRLSESLQNEGLTAVRARYIDQE